MRLTDEENVSESGIDIVASPPGKRLQSVLLLSGGEKADRRRWRCWIRGVSIHSQPIFILDEVDAPLDEPNIQRLTKLLQAMSEQPFHRHHPHQADAGSGAKPVRRYHAGTRRFAAGFSEIQADGRSRAKPSAAEAVRDAKERERELTLV